MKTKIIPICLGILAGSGFGLILTGNFVLGIWDLVWGIIGLIYLERLNNKEG